IQGQPQLVAVDSHKIGCRFFTERRAPSTRFVAKRRLDFEDLSPMVAKNLSAVGTAQHARKIDDLEALQGTGGKLGLSHSYPQFIEILLESMTAFHFSTSVSIKLPRPSGVRSCARTMPCEASARCTSGSSSA